MKKSKKVIAALLALAMPFSLSMENKAWAEVGREAKNGSIMQYSIPEKGDMSCLKAAGESAVLAEGDSKNVHWVLGEDGHLEITGTGDWERTETNTEENTEIGTESDTEEAFSADILENPIPPKAPWYEEAWRVTSAKVTLTGATDLSGMFADCEALESVDLTGLETENVTNMSYMFRGCIALETLDVSNFVTDKVTNMSCMFQRCIKLTVLDVSKFHTENVTDMSGMFEDCEKVAALDVSKFHTENVTDMEAIFRGCKEVKQLAVKDFNTAKVTSMKDMFWGCEQLTNLDVSKFNTASVWDMDGIFYGCVKLKTVDVSNFNTALAEDMGYMFYECSSLTELDVSGFDTCNAVSMCNMFYGCEKLTELNVANFNTEKVTDMSYMFSGCRSLKKLNVTNFDTSLVEDIKEMFYDCGNLKVLDLGSFDLGSLRRPGAAVPIGLFNNLPEEVITPYNTFYLVDIALNGSYTDEEGNYYIEMPKPEDAGVKLTLAFDGTSRDVAWSIDKETGHLEISGTGDSRNNTWVHYKKYIKSAKVTTTGTTSVEGMFRNCTELQLVDFSEFDAGMVEHGFYCFEGCEKLETILTPCNLKVYVSLPGLDWQDEEGESYMELPQDSASSIKLHREIEPEYVPGDVDYDGTITTDDALWILMKVAGKDTEKYHEDVAEVDGNPGITTDDALWILMKVAGKV